MCIWVHLDVFVCINVHLRGFSQEFFLVFPYNCVYLHAFVHVCVCVLLREFVCIYMNSCASVVAIAVRLQQ